MWLLLFWAFIIKKNIYVRLQVFGNVEPLAVAPAAPYLWAVAWGKEWRGDAPPHQKAWETQWRKIQPRLPCIKCKDLNSLIKVTATELQIAGGWDSILDPFSCLLVLCNRHVAAEMGQDEQKMLLVLFPCSDCFSLGTCYWLQLETTQDQG